MGGAGEMVNQKYGHPNHGEAGDYATRIDGHIITIMYAFVYVYMCNLVILYLVLLMSINIYRLIIKTRNNLYAQIFLKLKTKTSRPI